MTFVFIKRIFLLTLIALLCTQTCNAQPQFPFNKQFDESLFNWIKGNTSYKSGFPLSFSVEKHKKKKVLSNIGEADSVTGIIERIIVEEGTSVYDTALWQIVLTLVGGDDNLKKAHLPTFTYWKGGFYDLKNIRAGKGMGQSFIYNLNYPDAISSDINDYGQRGFIFRILNGHGNYLSKDPLDGKMRFKGFPNWPDIHWEDWKPIAGENAWVVIASMHLYHQKYYNKDQKKYIQDKPSMELDLAKELARAAILLQANNGAVRMAPIGTYYFSLDDIQAVDANEVAIELDQKAVESKKSFEKYVAIHGMDNALLKSRHTTWYYNEISTENNLSWYTAFNMLYQVTKDKKYKDAMDRIEKYLKWVWNSEDKYFYQGAHFVDGEWVPNTKHFATDVQTWGISKLSPKRIDEWFGEGAAYELWQSAKRISGIYSQDGTLVGVGYTSEHDRISIEWTMGAIYAMHELAEYYHKSNTQLEQELLYEAQTMRQGMEPFRFNISDQYSAYSYSSKRAWIPFGWFSHDSDVLSMVSTCWVFLYDAGLDPFYFNY